MTTTETKNEVRIGDKVRSYDFEGVRDCYVEGIVEEITANPTSPCESYKIRVEKKVVNGERMSWEHTPEYVFPPVNGTMSWMGRKMNGVEVEMTREELEADKAELDKYRDGNRREQKRLIVSNASNGEILPRISYMGGKWYIGGLVCGCCGKEYRARVADLRRHVRECGK